MKIMKTIKFHAAHRLMHHKGLCKNIHGHTYRVKIEIDGSINSRTGMVIDFGHIKELINDKFDHALLVNKQDNNLVGFANVCGCKYLKFDDEPTAESIAFKIRDIVKELADVKTIIMGIRVKVWETENSYADTGHLA